MPYKQWHDDPGIYPHYWVLLDAEREAKARPIRDAIYLLKAEVAEHETMLLDMYREEATP